MARQPGIVQALGPAMAAAAVLCFPLLWPMRVVADDVQMLAWSRGAAWEAWQGAFHGAMFRPLYALSARLVEPDTRDAARIVLLHAPALALVVMTSHRLFLRLGGAARLAPWVAALCVLHPAMLTALWQSDTASQSWSAALGMVLVALAAEPGRAGLRRIALLAGVAGLGALTKETFYGFCLAASVVMLWASPGKGKQERLRFAAPAFAVMWAIPAALVLWRAVRAGAELAGEETGRHALRFGGNLVLNAVLWAGGALAAGPTHAMTGATGAPGWYRALPVAGTVLMAAIAAFALWRRDEGAAEAKGAGWVLAGGVALTAVPALGLERVSELYTCGPHALAAVLVGLGATRASVRWPRAGWVLAALVVLDGAGGVARAGQVAATWGQAQQIQERIRQIACEAGPRNPPPRVRFAGECFSGGTYSTVIVPPCDAYNVLASGRVEAGNCPFEAMRVAAGEPSDIGTEQALYGRKVW